MIYQLKINLKYMKPPVWRRIQVDSKITFETLHQLIQIAFDWEDYHLHDFRIELKEGHLKSARLNNMFDGPFQPGHIIIKSQKVDNDFLGLGTESLDEEKEIIEDYLLDEKDKCLYTYDFGDDWQHEIVLEKILPVEKGVNYPRCIKAMRLAPEEDSRGSLEDDDEYRELLADNKALAIEINEHFSSFWSVPEQEGDNWSELFNNVDQYKKLKPWEWMSSDQIIVVGLPDSRELTYCSVLGEAGEEFGLAIYLGNDGLKSIFKTLEGAEDYHDLVMNQRSILISFSDRDELSPDDYKLIKRQGLSFRGKKQWPLFRSFKPGYYPWLIDGEEADIINIVLRQVIEVVQRTKNNPKLVNESHFDQWFARLPIQKSGKVEWKEELITPKFYEDEEIGTVKLFESEFAVRQMKNKYKKLNIPIEFSSFYGPEPVQENKGERPYYPSFVVAAEQKQGMIIFHDIIAHDQYAQQLQASFLKMIENLEHIPREVWLDNEKDAVILQPIFKLLSIKCIGVNKLPIIEQVRKEMFHFI
ncbi:plasmid pRiA4b ORF-3 family protein [Scopulibacillus cellulosilyticus]|uniref:Plasmid pRiA4b ORF-3 family protein n=1 Tax=Scopulibacillus cellulosilyticus TaxID=2665665 RepID=A0ABW2Q3G8_9BACL